MTKAEWMNHPIVDKEHAHDLERKAALYEFHHGVPRHQAEAKALEEYRAEQHGIAAGHHLAGMRAAHAAGNLDAAKLHHGMYVNHMKQLGLDPNGTPPPHIAAPRPNSAPVYDFKNHGADGFIAADHPEKEMAKSEEIRKAIHGAVILACLIEANKS